ncbi:hypothetical protein [Paludisphaera rhizosphaerae]|uniref:hypothetical protein n=1 Tax=Paludisphaera rhizosphaerae TaxID=2711216 RepID=UPI0013EA932F|nr:hypothetical protein [Paludisphaera rhizosphaerae]
MTHLHNSVELEPSTASAPGDHLAAAWRRESMLVLLMLAPTLAAIWTVPWFTTQDGLAHLYNATILVDSLRGGPVFGDSYEVRWDPLPNWGGHLTLIGLLAIVPPRTADRIMTSLTLIGVALAVAWLRRRTVSDAEPPSRIATALAALSALSFSWLMGFASFQLGVCLFAVTLGVWWPYRDELRPGRIAALAGLLTIGYFCHLVSAGLTVFAMGFLAVSAPAPDRTVFWRMRVRRLAVCFAPLTVLVLVYLRLAQRGGTMAPRFAKPGDLLTLSGWMGRIGWVDPVSFAVKNILPFTERAGAAFLAFSPLVWLTGAAVLLMLAAIWSRIGDGTHVGERRAWLGLSAALLAAGIFGPDSMGAGHGDYLPQRITLLALVSAVPTIGPYSRSLLGRLGGGAIFVALAMQAVSVWDYAVHAQKTVAPITESAPQVGRGVRIAALLGDLRTRFRVNPVLHAPDWLGVVGGNVVWNNYETRHYYFPVQFKPGLVRPDSIQLEEIALAVPPRRQEGVSLWDGELSRAHDAVDVVVAWRSYPELDAVTARWFEPAERLGDVTIWRRRDVR